MAEVAKVTSLYKATLHCPMHIQQNSMRLEMDADICQQVEDLEQRSQATCSRACGCSSQTRVLASQEWPPVQPHCSVPAKATPPVKRARANASTSSDTLPSMKHKSLEVAAVAKHRDSHGKTSKEASKQTAAPALTDTVQQKKRPAESAAGRSCRNAQNKPHKAAKTALPAYDRQRQPPEQGLTHCLPQLNQHCFFYLCILLDV
jgi:hypothetical protein